NFKPGTLTALGFSYDELRALNPRIVLAESSAFGDTGPWSARLGYGPLVRATTGVTRLWTSDGPGEGTEAARHAFYDATTVFPDHVVGRVTAIAALAALIHRDRTGNGAHVHISQIVLAESSAFGDTGRGARGWVRPARAGTTGVTGSDQRRPGRGPRRRGTRFTTRRRCSPTTWSAGSPRSPRWPR
ncbi:coA-transferase III family protein, partial [Mycobacterium intracellulare MIN_052511_1280]